MSKGESERGKYSLEYEILSFVTSHVCESRKEKISIYRLCFPIKRLHLNKMDVKPLSSAITTVRAPTKLK